MRRRGSCSPFQLDWFKPEQVVVDVSASAWVNLLGNLASPPSYDQLPSPSDVLGGSVGPDFDGLRLRCPGLF